jgi:hypothetical protein
MDGEMEKARGRGCWVERGSFALLHAKKKRSAVEKISTARICTTPGGRKEKVPGYSLAYKPFCQHKINWDNLVDVTKG